MKNRKDKNFLRIPVLQHHNIRLLAYNKIRHQWVQAGPFALPLSYPTTQWRSFDFVLGGGGMYNLLDLFGFNPHTPLFGVFFLIIQYIIIFNNFRLYMTILLTSIVQFIKIVSEVISLLSSQSLGIEKNTHLPIDNV